MQFFNQSSWDIGHLYLPFFSWPMANKVSKQADPVSGRNFLVGPTKCAAEVVTYLWWACSGSNVPTIQQGIAEDTAGRAVTYVRPVAGDWTLTCSRYRLCTGIPCMKQTEACIVYYSMNIVASWTCTYKAFLCKCKDVNVFISGSNPS